MDKNKNLIGKRVSYYNPYKNRTAYGPSSKSKF